MGYTHVYLFTIQIRDMICILLPRNHRNQENPPTLDNNALSINSLPSVYTMHDDYDRDCINAGKGVGSG